MLGQIKVWAIIGVAIGGLFLFQRWQLSKVREENSELTGALKTKIKELEILVESSNQNYRLLETRENERNRIDEQRKKETSKKLDKAGGEWGNVSLPDSIVSRLHN